jgi:uncharacterized protein YbaR (Trm112 family)
MIDAKFLEMLCCPETRQRLQPADEALLERLNAQIDAGRVVNRAGQAVARRCEGGLVRSDGLYLYPVCEGIPVLLADEGIPLGHEYRPESVARH